MRTNHIDYSFKTLSKLPKGKIVKLAYATEAFFDGFFVVILHHNNRIAEITKKEMTLDHHGYDSNTTRDRLDAIVTANIPREEGKGYAYRICKSEGRISLSVGGYTSKLPPIAFDRITLKRKVR